MLRLAAGRFALGLMTLLAASVPIFAGTEVLPGDLASAVLQMRGDRLDEVLARRRPAAGPGPDFTDMSDKSPGARENP